MHFFSVCWLHNHFTLTWIPGTTKLSWTAKIWRSQGSCAVRIEMIGDARTNFPNFSSCCWKRMVFLWKSTPLKKRELYLVLLTLSENELWTFNWCTPPLAKCFLRKTRRNFYRHFASKIFWRCRLQVLLRCILGYSDWLTKTMWFRITNNAE